MHKIERVAACVRFPRARRRARLNGEIFPHGTARKIKPADRLGFIQPTYQLVEYRLLTYRATHDVNITDDQRQLFLAAERKSRIQHVYEKTRLVIKPTQVYKCAAAKCGKLDLARCELLLSQLDSYRLRLTAPIAVSSFGCAFTSLAIGTGFLILRMFVIFEMLLSRSYLYIY